MAAHCVEQANGFVSTNELYECYQNYCQSLNHDFIRNKQTFSTKFKALMENVPSVTNIKKRINGNPPCNGYVGLALI